MTMTSYRLFSCCASLLCVTGVLAQPAQPPARPGAPSVQIIGPDPVVPRPPNELLLNKRVSEEDAADYRKARANYDECRRSRAGEFRLTEAADNVILVRDRWPFWEGEFQRNTSMRLQFPQGYDQLLARSFQDYRAAGGTAASVSVVQAVPPPCARPEEPSPRGPSPVTETKSLNR